MLDAIGKTFSEVVTTDAGQFVLIGNASRGGNLIDVTDIYAIRDGRYQKIQTVPSNQKLDAVLEISEKKMNEELQRRKGLIVKP